MNIIFSKTNLMLLALSVILGQTSFFATTSYATTYSYEYPTVLMDEVGGDANQSFELNEASGYLTYGVVGYGDDTSVTGNGYSDVQVNGVYSVDGSTNLLSTDSVYSATGYLGMFGAKNDGPFPDMTDGDGDGNINIGQIDDGYMNGSISVQNKDDGYPYYEIEGSDDVYDFSGLEFLSSYEDVDGVAGDNDPGWIYLGKNDVGGSEEYATAKKGDDVLNIADAVKFHLTSGTDWELEMNPNTLGLVKPLLGNNTFDHLALVIKSATAFEIFDIDFTKIFAWEDDKGSYFDFKPYTITGTLQTSWGKDVSHVSVWAHDPAGTVVPEPSTLILLGSGLLGLGVYARRRKK